MNDFAPGAAPPRGPQFDNRRVLAGVIDVLIVAVIGGVIGVAAGSWSPTLSAVVLGWGLFYYFALESGAGQTVGKRLVGLRVTMADGSPADMRAIAIRTVLRLIDGIGLYVVGLIVMLVSGERRQRLGDMAGGTIVTSADFASAPTAAVAVPTAPEAPAPAASFVPPAVVEPAVVEEPTSEDVARAAPVEEPVAVEEPAPVVFSPAAPAEEPVVVVEPAAVEEEPVVVEPAAVEVEPVVVEPAAVEVEPVVVEPAAVEVEPVVVEPAAVEEEPVVVVERAPVEDEPVVVVEPASVEEEPVAAVEPVSALEPAPAVDFAPDVDASPAAPEPAASVASDPNAFFETAAASAPQPPELTPFQPFSGPEEDVPPAPPEDEQVKVRSVETISNIDLLMGDVEEDEAAGRTP